MRRFLLALLVPLGTAVLPGVESAGAVVPKGSSLHHPHLRSSAALRQMHVATQARRALGEMASTMHVSVSLLREEWQRVAQCEVHGNWRMRGPRYSGIGFLQSSWLAYGGGTFATDAGLATVDEQILVGMRITGGWVPDQYGCSPVGW